MTKPTLAARAGAPIAAALVTSAILAALALGGQANTQAQVSGQPPTPSGQAAGQLVLDGNTITVLSFSAGVSNPASVGSGGGGAGAGKASFSSLNLMKPVDATTPVLNAAVASGRHFPTAVLTAQWGVGASTASLKYELEDVIVESAQQSGGGDAPVESISLAFGKVAWTFTDANGSVTRGWNIVTNTES
jgi:type VI secretion system secreted protein Hcp